MRQSPSIIPTDRLDRDIYLVLEDFSSGAAWRETDEGETDVSAVVEDLLTQANTSSPSESLLSIPSNAGRVTHPKISPRN